MKRPYLFVLLVAIAALSAVLVLPEISGIDETVRIRVANSLVTRGEVDIPFWEGFDDKYTNVYVNTERGKTYGLWNIGQSLVLVPFVALSNPLREGVNDPVGKSLTQGAIVCIGYAMFVNVLLALATYGVLRQMRLSCKSSVLGVLVLALCTQWLVWGMSLQEESLCALLLMVALWSGLKARASPRAWRWGIAMGCCFGFLANVRFNGAFTAGAILIWAALIIPDRKRALMFAGTVVLAALPWAALLLWYNWARTGDAFWSPYQANFALMRQDLQMDTGWHFSLVRFSFSLFGLDNGAIWFALPLLMLPALKARARRPGLTHVQAKGASQPSPSGLGFQRLELGALFMLGALALHAILLSGFYAGVGVQGAGSPRYLGHQLILLGPLAWIAARRAWLARKTMLRFAVVALFMLSTVFQVSARLLNPELEASQDVNYEHLNKFVDTGARPLPYQHLPRRFKNLVLAFRGRLADYSYPPSHEIQQGEARHTMLMITPAYLKYLERYFRPEAGSSWEVATYIAWIATYPAFFIPVIVLLRMARKPRSSAKPQPR